MKKESVVNFVVREIPNVARNASIYDAIENCVNTPRRHSVTRKTVTTVKNTVVVGDDMTDVDEILAQLNAQPFEQSVQETVVPWTLKFTSKIDACSKVRSYCRDFPIEFVPNDSSQQGVPSLLWLKRFVEYFN